MPRSQEKKPSSKLNITGNVNTGGGDVAGGNIKKGDVNQSRDSQIRDINKQFSPIFEKISQKSELSDEDKSDLRNNVEQIRDEVEGKEAKADETFIETRLRNIERIAPDILEVVLKTMTNPALGLTTVIEKIADKVKNVKKKENS